MIWLFLSPIWPKEIYFQLNNILNVICSDIDGGGFFSSTLPLIIAFQREVGRSLNATDFYKMVDECFHFLVLSSVFF